MLIFFASMFLSSAFVIFLCYEDMLEKASLFTIFLLMVLIIYFIVKRLEQMRLIFLSIVLGLSIGYLSLAFCISNINFSSDNIQITFQQDNKKSAIVLICEGDPKDYSIPELSKKLSKVYPFYDIPFKLYEYKSYYNQNTNSKQMGICDNIYNYVQKEFEDNHNVFMCPSLDTELIKRYIISIAHKGYKNITIAYYFSFEGRDYEEITYCIDSMGLYEHGIKINHTYPLWNEDATGEYFTQQINERVSGSEVYNTGIVLIGDINKNKTQQSIFMNNIKQSLQFEGYKKSNIKVFWIGDKKSNIKNVWESLQNINIRKIVVVPCAYAIDTMFLEVQLPKLIEKSKVFNGINYCYIETYNDNLNIVKNFNKRLRSHL